jgi:hypothetical protein
MKASAAKTNKKVKGTHPGQSGVFKAGEKVIPLSPTAGLIVTVWAAPKGMSFEKVKQEAQKIRASEAVDEGAIPKGRAAFAGFGAGKCRSGLTPHHPGVN